MDETSIGAQVRPSKEVLSGSLEVGRPVLAAVGGCEKRDGRRFPSAIRGWSAQEYLLLDRPEDFVARPSDRCVVQFLSDGVVCGFSAEFLDSGATRPPLFRIAWPAVVETLSLRKHDRVEVDLPCTAVLPCGTRMECRMVDISAGGCRLVLPERLMAHTEVLLDFDLGTDQAFSGVRAVVRCSSQEGTGFPAGVQFEELDGARQHAIDFFVAAERSGMRMAGEQGSAVLLLHAGGARMESMGEAIRGTGIRVVEEENLAHFFQRLGSGRFRAALIPAAHPHFSGSQLVRIVRDAAPADQLHVAVYGGGEKPGQDAKGIAYSVVLTPEDAAAWVRETAGAGPEEPAPVQPD